MKRYANIFNELISIESLFIAWSEFRKGKTKRRDVQEFSRHLEKNIFRLQRELVEKKYKHSPYSSFYIHDPKVRHIRKASVKDRLVHQAAYTILTRIYEPRFVNDLYSSRVGKGTHAGVNALTSMTLKVSRNLTQPCWALKCDVSKFYDSVDHAALLDLIRITITDPSAQWLLTEIVESFHHEGTPGKGLPIGNLTSQIFTNIYLNELDQFVKQTLRVKYYARFADDLVLLSTGKKELQNYLPLIKKFLQERLKLQLHPKKVSIRPLHQGVDFLGYVVLPHHRVLRTKTKRRMLRKLDQRLNECFSDLVSKESLNQTLQSYLGLISHVNAFELKRDVLNRFMAK